MLVLDNLHWADRSSLLLLEFVAREIAARPVLVVGTYREVEVSRCHPLTQSLGNLVQEAGFRRLPQGLSKTGVAKKLGISLRTVAHHVTGILTKTGAANRAEAAAYAAARGLLVQ